MEGNRDNESPSQPDSPVFPKPAALASLSEIKKSDLNLNSSMTLEEGKVGRRESLQRKRYSSQGDTDVRRGRSLYSVSRISTSTEPLGCVQLFVLPENPTGTKEWKETSRWVKYQQDLEEGSERLGRPHVSPLAYPYLTKLQHLVTKHCIELLELEASNVQDLAASVTKALVSSNKLDIKEEQELLEDLQLNYRTAEKRIWVRSDSVQSPDPLLERNESCRERSHSISRRIVHKVQEEGCGANGVFEQPDDHIEVEICDSYAKETFKKRGRLSSLAKFFSTEEFDPLESPFLPYSSLSEATKILVREGFKGENPLILIVRLLNPFVIPAGSKDALPTRFIFLLLSPQGAGKETTEVAKTLGTLLSNAKFYNAIKTSQGTEGFLEAVNDFTQATILITPAPFLDNIYDLLPVHLLQEKFELLTDGGRKEGPSFHRCDTSKFDGFDLPILEAEEKDEWPQKPEIPGPFESTGRMFGGVINDIKRRLPDYKSDFVDGFNAQTLSTVIFLYFASIAHNVTFGGLLGVKTNGLIGVSETLVCAGTSGVIFSLLSCQPFNIIAPTGPLLVFDELLYQFLERHDVEFLPARFWIGIWVAIIALIVAAFEGSKVVKHVSRFTMETFAALISIIFCYESLESLIHIYEHHPLRSRNTTGLLTEPGIHSDSLLEEPNTALLSTFLMFGTFWIAYKLKHLRYTNIFPSGMRNFLSDFGVPIAIILTVSIDRWIGDVYTNKIKVPSGFQPTTPSVRGWVVNPFGMQKTFNGWVPLLSIVPGALVFLLMFMTVEICEKIMMASGNLKKGSGMHLDPLILAAINVACGLFGFPWVSVATLKALAHIAAQTVYSRDNPPGIPPSVLGIRETRLAGLLMSIMIGLSIFMAPVLKLIPMPVLFGVFLYMGITSFLPTQLYERLVLLLVPVDSHPQSVYVRRVSTRKIHMYTGIQVASLAALWAVKSVKEVALFFPLILMLLVPIRRALQYIYTESELQALDGEQKTQIQSSQD